MKKSLLSSIKKDIIASKDSFFLLLTVFTFMLLRIPSLIEPYWYGDEGIYQVIGMALRNGRLLYRDIWDNKPPLLYVLYSFVNGDLFSIRSLSLLAGIGAVVAQFFLSKNLFKKRLSQYLSTGVFALLFGLPLIEGNIANAENFMLLPITMAFYFISRNTQRNKELVVAGILLSISFLFKSVAVFDFAAAILIIVIAKYGPKGIFKGKG